MARKMEYRLTGKPDRAPTHPGAILREDVLPALGIGVAVAARALGVTRQTLHRILSERMGVLPEMAVRLGKFCGNSPGLWLRLQSARDLWHAERRLKREVAAIHRFGGSASAGARGNRRVGAGGA